MNAYKIKGLNFKIMIIDICVFQTITAIGFLCARKSPYLVYFKLDAVKLYKTSFKT